MKKYLFIIPLTFLLSTFYIVPALAVQTDQAGYLISYRTTDGFISLQIINYHFDHWDHDELYNNGTDNYFYYGKYVWSDTFSYPDYSIPDVVEFAENYIATHPLIETSDRFFGGLGTVIVPDWKYYVSNYPEQRYLPSGIDITDISNPPAPPEPEPGSSSWIVDVWNYVLDILGIDDPFSEDIEDLVSGPGQAGHVKYITPTPTPLVTPPPTIIYDDNGDPAYSLTINEGDNITNNDGSDFNIFDVDIQIGDGGSSNPRDGLNSVMDSSYDYLAEFDTSPVTNSFSIIPNDWFLLIGVLAALPFIAGFIMRLLK